MITSVLKFENNPQLIIIRWTIIYLLLKYFFDKFFNNPFSNKE